MSRLVVALISFLLTAPNLFAGEKIDIFPASRYDQSGIYLNLILFWIALLGLVIILILRLREIERVQKMEESEKDEKIPFLE